MCLSMKTQNIMKDFEKLEDMFEFTNLDEKHEMIGNKNKKVTCKFKIETPKNNWIDDFLCLRSKMYSSKCGDDVKNKLKGFLNLKKSILILKNIKNI